MTPWYVYLWDHTPAWEKAVCLVMLAVPAVVALWGLAAWCAEKVRRL